MDRYAGYGFNPRDVAFVIIAVAVSLLLLFQNTALGGGQAGSYSTIYYPILAFAMIIISVAIATRGRLFNEVIFGSLQSPKQLYRQIVIVALVSIAVAWFVYTSNQPAEAFIPLAISGLGVAALGTIAIVVYIGPLVEELMFRCGLTPTITKALGNTNVLAALGFVGAIVFLFMFQIAILGYAFLIIAFAALGLKFTKHDFLAGDVAKHSIAILMSVTIWALFHVWSYGQLPNVYSLMETAAIFGIVIELANWFFQNSISGLVMHPAINSAVVLALAPALVGAVILINILNVLMIVVLYSGKQALNVVRR